MHLQVGRSSDAIHIISTWCRNLLTSSGESPAAIFECLLLNCITTYFIFLVDKWAIINKWTHGRSQLSTRKIALFLLQYPIQVQYLGVWLWSVTSNHDVAELCQILDLQSFSHPSWPKAMFSSILELSSLSSWVMWHHFSLEHRTQFQSRFKSCDSADLWGGPRSVWKNVARQRGADWAEVTEPKRLCFFFLPPLHLKDASDNLRVCRKLYIFLKWAKLVIYSVTAVLEIADEKAFNNFVPVFRVSYLFRWRDLHLLFGQSTCNPVTRVQLGL